MSSYSSSYLDESEERAARHLNRLPGAARRGGGGTTGRHVGTQHRFPAVPLSRRRQVETAIGARMNADGQIELNAPLGLESLFHLTITPNPRHAIPAVFAERVSTKGWLRLWPKLEVQEMR